MANEEHLKIIEKGVEAWNAWREANSDIKPDLNHADLSDRDLSYADLREADLRQAHLNDSKLRDAMLTGAVLAVANLIGADLNGADLTETNLTKADLSNADLGEADLSKTNLTKANLVDANLSSAILDHADVSGASIGWTEFGDNDLSTVRGLESVNHVGPSTIGIDTLFKSDGRIPEAFLRGAGLPDDFIIFIPSLVGRAIEFYSCFISYSHQDEEFSKQLHSKMRTENLRVWFAPEDMKAGRKLHEEIFRAIQVHDKLLLVLSDHSMKSEWVMSEIRRAKKVEREENRRKLFPIRLVDFETIQNWECFDADSGKDLAAEVREYYIPDFSNWKDHDSFESESAKLLRALKATEG
ncbi:MAG TPA: hypothetical protein DC054_11255 [Blastocatellia bacterium]|nr:hypothetical protein [Blastocatellia bacterium]